MLEVSLIHAFSEKFTVELLNDFFDLVFILYADSVLSFYSSNIGFGRLVLSEVLDLFEGWPQLIPVAKFFDFSY